MGSAVAHHEIKVRVKILTVRSQQSQIAKQTISKHYSLSPFDILWLPKTSVIDNLLFILIGELVVDN